jgi:hypothetical protein
VISDDAGPEVEPEDWSLDPFDDGDAEDDELDQPACCRCLRPAGPCPLHVWRTLDDDQELDEWVVCWPCVRKETDQGKTLQQVMLELVGYRRGHPRAGSGGEV